jgi:hypothetical protein
MLRRNSSRFRSYAQDQKTELAAARQIEVDLDAAIFSDGLLVGLKHTNLDQDFMTYFDSKQSCFAKPRGILMPDEV